VPKAFDDHREQRISELEAGFAVTDHLGSVSAMLTASPREKLMAGIAYACGLEKTGEALARLFRILRRDYLPGYVPSVHGPPHGKPRRSGHRRCVIARRECIFMAGDMTYRTEFSAPRPKRFRFDSEAHNAQPIDGRRLNFVKPSGWLKPCQPLSRTN
jgi:hypothetical protein